MSVVYLYKQAPQRHKEPHELPRVGREDPLHIVAAQVFGSSPHGRRNHIARRIHQEFCKPLKDFLNLLRVGLLEVLDIETNANIADTPSNLAIGLVLN